MKTYTYVMSRRMHHMMTAPRMIGGLGLSDENSIIQYLNQTAGLNAEITDIEIRG